VSAPVADPGRLLPTRLARVSAVLAAAALTAIAAETPRVAPLLLATSAAAALVVGAILDWRFGITAFVVWLTVGDLLRKFTGGGLLILGATELVAAAAMLRFGWEVWRGRVPRPVLPVTGPLAVFAVWVVARALPELVHSPWTALNGINAWLFFVPFLYAGYAWRSQERTAGWPLAAVVMGAAAAAGGLAQGWFGLDVLNPAETSGLPLKLLHSYSHTESVPRPNSLFMHAGRLSGVLLAVLWVLPAALAQAFARLGVRVSLAAAASAITAALVLSGQRAALLSVAAGAVVIVLALRGRVLRSRGLWLALGAGALAAALLVRTAPSTLTLRFYGDSLSPAAVEERLADLRYTFGGMQSALQTTRWGFGTGAASTGRAHALGVAWNDPAVMPLEGGLGVLVWEWGIAGPVLWFWLSGTLAHALWRRTRLAREDGEAWTSAAALAAVCASMGVWFIFSASAYQSYPLQALVWLTAGHALAPCRTADR
jgi:hypothetical protein